MRVLLIRLLSVFPHVSAANHDAHIPAVYRGSSACGMMRAWSGVCDSLQKHPIYGNNIFWVLSMVAATASQATHTEFVNSPLVT